MAERNRCVKVTDRYAVGAIECRNAMTFSSAISVQRNSLSIDVTWTSGWKCH